MGNLLMLLLLSGGMVLKNRVSPVSTRPAPLPGAGFPAVFSQTNQSVNSLSGHSGNSIARNFQTFLKNLTPNFGASAPAISNLSPLRTFDPAFAYNPNRTIQPIIRAH